MKHGRLGAPLSAADASYAGKRTGLVGSKQESWRARIACLPVRKRCVWVEEGRGTSGGGGTRWRWGGGRSSFATRHKLWRCSLFSHWAPADHAVCGWCGWFLVSRADDLGQQAVAPFAVTFAECFTGRLEMSEGRNLVAIWAASPTGTRCTACSVHICGYAIDLVTASCKP